ncbi:efflux RND transporter periplasmic adaptor subunit [Pontiellaceae bacterium B12219]|nr:efflux RND transporter periplasmic adaptor subunit [Pontiellaceae bacterium B12219]
MEQNLSEIGTEFPPSKHKSKGPGRWKPILLAVAVPLGLILLLWMLFREQLAPAVPVETGRVILLKQEGSGVPTSGTAQLLFQASGWVEPDPWPESLVAKTDGFVDAVFVKEGEFVTNGQLVATLDPLDAQLALALADANVAKHKALLEAQKKQAEAEVKQAEAARFRVEAVVARLTRERDTADRFANASPGVVSHMERVAAEQGVVEFEAEEKAARAALNAMEAKAIAAASDIHVAEAALASAVKERAVAQLALDRTEIRSPMDGLVLHRFVQPGDKRMVTSDAEHSAHILSVYRPSDLQIRVDVPISEAGKVQAGQPVKISTALLPGRIFEGHVIRIIGQADLQRNTLQVKVKIKDPDPKLRPDVLCRVEFMSLPTSGTSGSVPTLGTSLWIPVGALASDTATQQVWVVDPMEGNVEPRTVQLGSAERDGFREVREGVRANERVVIRAGASLEEGVRVKEIER